jgi:hypothetical protein
VFKLEMPPKKASIKSKAVAKGKRKAADDVPNDSVKKAKADEEVASEDAEKTDVEEEETTEEPKEESKKARIEQKAAPKSKPKVKGSKGGKKNKLGEKGPQVRNTGQLELCLIYPANMSTEHIRTVRHHSIAQANMCETELKDRAENISKSFEQGLDKEDKDEESGLSIAQLRAEIARVNDLKLVASAKIPMLNRLKIRLYDALAAVADDDEEEEPTKLDKKAKARHDAAGAKLVAFAEKEKKALKERQALHEASAAAKEEKKKPKPRTTKAAAAAGDEALFKEKPPTNGDDDDDHDTDEVREAKLNKVVAKIKASNGDDDDDTDEAGLAAELVKAKAAVKSALAEVAKSLPVEVVVDDDDILSQA